ncbi:MAG: shikimate dehydrogenase [Nitrospirae bacterium]|nr:shikimate dehydrogenase [Nitrospirota bacterium]
MHKKYGILAHPAGHSLSPAIFNAAFKEAGLDAEYRIYDVRERDLAEFMENVRHEPVSGLSVSLPHKEAVMDYLDEVDEDARGVGAVNCVVNRGGFLHGYNTDFVGSNKALKEVVGGLRGRKVVVIGAGGAARAVVYGLLKEGAEVAIINRHKEKAEELASEFGVPFGLLSEAEKFDGEILAQASSIWTLNPEAELSDLISGEYVKRFEIVMDIVYKPLMTPLLVAAESMGKTVITGDKMLLYQAVEAFKLFMGKEATPVEIMKKELSENLV